MIRLRRTLVVLTAGLAIWAVVIALFDGVLLEVGRLQISSRNPVNPALAALMLWIVTIIVSRRSGGLGTIADDWMDTVRLAQRTMLGLAWASAWTIRQSVRRAPEIIALVAAAIYIRCWLVPTPLWLDEEMIALNVRDRSFAELSGVLWLGQSAPLGWLAIQRLALLTLGPGEVALRFIPTLFGLGTIGVAVWIGRRWLTGVGGTVLVALCAFGTWLAHYPFEVKHYSADVFWALLLPALAIRAAEAGDLRTRTRRTAVWWIAAALGHWLSNGALFVAPGSALALTLLMWRRGGARAAIITALLGIPWLVSFAAYFRLSIGPMLRDGAMHEYWSNELPASGLSVWEIVSWMATRLDDLAVNPAGSGWAAALWLVFVAGCVLGSERRLGAMLLTAPASMFLLAGLGSVPLYQRFAIWIVPALYGGIALGLDRLWRIARAAIATRTWWRLALIGAAASLPLVVAADIVQSGHRGLTEPRPADKKQNLDDRTSVHWLVSQRRQGDAVATTRLGWPAIWWYANDSIAGDRPDAPTAGAFRLEHEPAADNCDPAAFGTALARYQRLIVYVGFPDAPEGFDQLLLEQLGSLGTIVDLKVMSVRSRGAIVELGTTRPSPVDPRTFAAWPKKARVRLDGCIGVRPARRW